MDYPKITTNFLTCYLKARLSPGTYDSGEKPRVVIEQFNLDYLAGWKPPSLESLHISTFNPFFLKRFCSPFSVSNIPVIVSVISGVHLTDFQRLALCHALLKSHTEIHIPSR